MILCLLFNFKYFFLGGGGDNELEPLWQMKITNGSFLIIGTGLLKKYTVHVLKCEPLELWLNYENLVIISFLTEIVQF